MDHTTTYRAHQRSSSRRVLCGIAVVVAATGISLVHPSVSSSASSIVDVLRGDDHGGFGVRDGAVPDETTVFDRAVPALARLDPALLTALRRAGKEAAEDDVELAVNSGWRSSEYQERLLRDAVSTYGSEAEAAKWVATPETSAHVSGDAIDVAADAAAWLSEHGADHGLCQVYANEPWHFELRPEAVDHGCPRRYADPAHDPRMQR
jgi:hypothetical protein